jgi:DNA-binding NarL/FixJ family response regulator
MKKKIVIVEDDLIFQRGLITYLNNNLGKYGIDFEIIKAVTNKEDAINIAREFNVDLFLVDINLNGKEKDGIDLACQLVKTYSNAKIIMLSCLEDPEILNTCIFSGAVNFIKKENYKILPSEIKSIFSDFNPTLIMTNYVRQLEREKILGKLSDAQKRVFLCMLYGKGLNAEDLSKKALVDVRTYYNYTSKIKNILKLYDWNVLESLFLEYKNSVQSIEEMNISNFRLSFG